MRETVSASKKLGWTEAVALARQARRLIAVKGKKVTTVELSQNQPSDEALAALMLGPTGNLRAPTLRVGDTVVVGYNDEVFADTCN